MPRGRPRKNRNSVLIKSAELVGWAIGGLEREIAETRAKLTALNAQVANLKARAGKRVAAAAGPAAAASFDEPAVAGRKRRRSPMSAEARKRMSEMLRKRWADRKKKGFKAL
jgi:hypothetical protein